MRPSRRSFPARCLAALQAPTHVTGVCGLLAGILVLAVLLQSRPRASQDAPGSVPDRSPDSQTSTSQTPTSQTPTSQPPQNSSQAQGIRFTTLPGFTIERVVPNAKVDSYVAMTFDSLGRLVVSKEYENPRILLDNDGDGVYESEKVITDKVKNCQGLWFDGRTLYGDCAPGDGPPQGGTGGGGPNAAPQTSGLFKMTDTDGDDVTDTFEKINGYVGGIQEHGPHAIRRGPDGNLTLITGNNTFVPDEMINPLSPQQGAKESQFIPALPDGRGFGPSIKEGWHGTIERLEPDQKHFTLLVGGLRNAYDFAFNLEGELFTFDSDMEWDINMPWYRAVRSVHAIPGGNYGYRNGSGKFPPYYIDSLPNMRDLGRGSPVGVEFYQHNVYPAQFHDAFFEADWSRGRLLWTALKRDGATYKTVEEKTEFVHGEPLNITDVETGPDGFIYFTTGGRGTEGGVYRVRYTGGTPPPNAEGILGVVRQPAPMSSWGWAALEKKKASMGASWGPELEKLARDGSAKGEDRAQAIYLLQRHGPKPGAELLTALIADPNADVRAATVFVAGAQEATGPAAVVATALKDKDPFVQRRAAEALVRMGLSVDKPSPAPVADIYALLNSPDRFVRWSGRVALERTPRAQWKDLAEKETKTPGAFDAMVALIDTSTSDADLAPIFKKQLGLLAKATLPVDDRLRAIRTFQLAVLAAKDLPPDLRKQVNGLLIGQFPAKDERLNRQLALTLAWAGQPAAVAKILAAMPAGDTNQQLQMHYVYALRVMKDGWTPAQKTQMMDWYAKAVTWRGGASFPGFINLLFDATLDTFNADEKKLAYQKVPQFAPLTEEEVTAIAQRMAAMRAAAGAPPAAGAQANGARPAGAAAAGGAQAQAAPRPQGGGGMRGPSPANARAKGVAAISREEILEEQIFTPLRQPPSIPGGQTTYEKVCSQCHRFGAMGADVGPDLTSLNSRFKKKDILEAILWPSRTISDQYEMTMVETKDGKTFGGFVVREDDQRVTMRTADASARSFDIPKANVKSRQKSPVSLMPEGLIDELSQQDIASLMAFLQSTPPQ